MSRNSLFELMLYVGLRRYYYELDQNEEKCSKLKNFPCSWANKQVWSFETCKFLSRYFTNLPDLNSYIKDQTRRYSYNNEHLKLLLNKQVKTNCSKNENLQKRFENREGRIDKHVKIRIGVLGSQLMDWAMEIKDGQLNSLLKTSPVLFKK